jgi:hypothetical protein
MKNIHVISTDKPSRLHSWTDEKGTRLELCDLEYSHTRNTQHIYITNSEEIKESFIGWFIGQCGFYKKCVDTKIINNELYLLDYLGNTDRLIWCKKIILTTDQDLIKDGVQAIDDEFLEWFVKNPRCEVVKIENHVLELGYNHYKIIIPKEEPKQTVQEYEQQGLQKHSYELEPKQETLEEKASLIYPVELWGIEGSLIRQLAFMNGVEWQSKQNDWKTVFDETPLNNTQLLVQNPQGIVYLANWREGYQIFDCQAKSESSLDWKWKTI